jgi:hypothetical protein
MPPSASWAIELPTTLQIASVGCPLRFIPAGRQRVGRLAALRDGEHQRVVVDRRVAIAQFAGVLDLDRHPGQLLDQIFADQAACQLVPQAVRMMRSTAAQLLRGEVQPAELGRRVVVVERPRMAFAIDSGCSKISLSM